MGMRHKLEPVVVHCQSESVAGMISKASLLPRTLSLALTPISTLRLSIAARTVEQAL